MKTVLLSLACLSVNALLGAVAGLWFAGPAGHWSDFWLMGLAGWVALACPFGQLLHLHGGADAPSWREFAVGVWIVGMVTAAWMVNR